MAAMMRELDLDTGQHAMGCQAQDPVGRRFQHLNVPRGELAGDAVAAHVALHAAASPSATKGSLMMISTWSGPSARTSACAVAISHKLSIASDLLITPCCTKAASRQHCLRNSASVALATARQAAVSSAVAFMMPLAVWQ